MIDGTEPGGAWLLTVLERLFSEVDRAKILAEVEAFRERYPDERPPDIARRLIAETALASGVRGSVLSVPRSVPGVGWVLGLVGSSVDTLAMVREQSLLIFRVAAVYGHSLYDARRMIEALAIFGILSGDESSVAQLEGVLRTIPSGALRGTALAVVREAAIAIGKRLAARGTLKWLPLIGIPLGGAINYLATEDVGASALKFYSKRNISERLLGEWLSEEQQKRSAILDLYLYMYSTEPDLSEEVRERARKIGRSLGLSDTEERVAAALQGAGPTARDIAGKLPGHEARRQLFERAALMGEALPSEFKRGFLLANLADALGLSEEERREVLIEIEEFLGNNIPEGSPSLIERLGVAAEGTARSLYDVGSRGLQGLRGLFGGDRGGGEGS